MFWLSDLNDIAELLAVNNEDAARQLVKTIFLQVEQLVSFPESGRIPPELQHFSYREVVVNPCRVFYKYDGKRVFILYLPISRAIAIHKELHEYRCKR